MKNQKRVQSLAAAAIVVGIVAAACGDPDADNSQAVGARLAHAADVVYAENATQSQTAIGRPDVVQVGPADRLQERADSAVAADAVAQARSAESARYDAMAAAHTQGEDTTSGGLDRAGGTASDRPQAQAQAQADNYSDQAEAQRHARLAATADLQRHADSYAAAYAEAQAETEVPVRDGLSQGHHVR